MARKAANLRRLGMWSSAEDHADLLVAERPEMAESLLRRNRIVGGHLREGQVVAGGVDEDDGECPLPQEPVVLVGGVSLHEVAPGKDHARCMLVQQHVHIVDFGQAVRPTGAEHRGKTQLGQGAPHHFGQRREDGVAQLGQDQAHQAGTLASQLGRTFVTEDIERSEDGGAGGGRHAWPTVEDAAYRRLTDAHFLGNLCQPAASRAASLRQVRARIWKDVGRKASFCSPSPFCPRPCPVVTETSAPISIISFAS